MRGKYRRIGLSDMSAELVTIVVAGDRVPQPSRHNPAVPAAVQQRWKINPIGTLERNKISLLDH